MQTTVALLLAAACLAPSQAYRQAAAGRAGLNPIRKVVNMLQAMQKKVQEEGEAEEKLYKRFSCHCAKGGADLSASISAAETKVPAVGSDIEAAESRLTQTKEALRAAQADRSAAKAAVAEATALREKEAAAFSAEKAD